MSLNLAKPEPESKVTLFKLRLQVFKRALLHFLLRSKKFEVSYCTLREIRTQTLKIRIFNVIKLRGHAAVVEESILTAF